MVNDIMNLTNNTDESIQQSFLWTTPDIIKGTTFSVMTMVVVVTNIICLLALKHTQIKPTTRVLMYSLNAADLCTGIIILFPLAAASFVNAWVFGYVGCVIYVLFGTVPTYTCNWTLLAMAVERYIAVTKPLKYKVIFTLRRARLVVVFIWIASLTYEIINKALKQFQVYFYPPSDQCWSLGRGRTDFIIKLSVIVLIYGPFVAFTIIYLVIFCTIRQQNIRRKEMTNDLSTFTQDAQNHGDSRSQEHRTTITFMIITFAYFVTTSGPTTAFATEIISGKTYGEWLWFLVHIMTYSNAWINTMIYFFRNPSFRSSVMGLLKLKNRSNKKISVPTTSPSV